MTIDNQSHIDFTHSRAHMNFKQWKDQRNNIENQLSRLKSIFEENPRYLKKIQNLLSEEGIIFNSRDCGALSKSVEEAQKHAEVTFHSNMSESTETVLNLVCATCCNPCQSKTKTDLHTRRIDHTKFVDNTLKSLVLGREVGSGATEMFDELSIPVKKKSDSFED
ncbi:hypothetical protein V6N12_031140 [Hibiscus sabdariffa]|uniref:Uncharacterized protein n=1 Tax=Hibiscus sabdariffa TaxID=183260 RepID=A0ABR2E824_9ROSI